MKSIHELLETLSPAELEYLNSCIYRIHKEKVTADTTNYENLIQEVKYCPHCGSIKFIKYGKKKGKQKFLCKGCSTIFGCTTKTLFSHSKTTFHDWLCFIACEIGGCTLQQESIIIMKSKTTCFNMRHKLYSALENDQEDHVLQDLIELDPVYTKINLKGTKKEKMPRKSKRRGKHKSTKLNHSMRGLSNHKICLISAIDEHDTMVFKIGGLGPESEDKFHQYAYHFKEGSTIVCDSKPCIRNFAQQHKMTSEVIKVVANKTKYTTENGNSLADINQLHQEFGEMIRKKHGVSTRHLQGYLTWLIYCKKLRYTTEGKRRGIAAYLDIFKRPITMRNQDIYKIPLPVDLFKAYGDYHYGIFS